jgi:membrane protein YdbS with pleckstrin-like domain
MLEFLKLITDLFVLRDAKQKGEFSGNSMLLGFGFGFVLFLYATVLPAGLLWIKHPQYRWVFFAAVAVNAVALVYVLLLGTRCQRRAKARFDAQSANSTATPE